MNRILVIRGGAIGDFVVTLPAIKLLRGAWPSARLEILGYKHIIALAEKRFYAHAVRSIEYGRLASFFAKNAELPAALTAYFGSFDLIVSYLFDPDGVFEANVRRCGQPQLLAGPAKIATHEHAAQQFARPLEALGLSLSSIAAELFPNEEDRAAADKFLPTSKRLVAVHPGSGSTTKNWSIANWNALGQQLGHENRDLRLVVIAGEADTAQLTQLRQHWAELPVSFVVAQPLPTVAAVLARCELFLGHDSGISHIAAAVGAPSLLLFGPTEPRIWAPQNGNARVLQAPTGALVDLSLAEVLGAAYELMRIGIRT